MNGHLLDTSTIRHWNARNVAIETRMAALPETDLLYVSSVTLGEIEFGHLHVDATDPKKQQEFRDWIDTRFQKPVLYIAMTTSIYYAHFRRLICDNYSSKGKRIELYEDASGQKLGIDENDLWLAAQAHERGLELITSDKMTRIREVLHGRIVLGERVRIEYWPPA